jgi:hypothetical protein
LAVILVTAGRVLTTAVVAAFVLAGCASANGKADDTAGKTVPSQATSQPARSTPTPTPKSDRRTITYRRQGTAGSTDRMYSRASGVKREKGVPLPWTMTFTVARDDVVSLSVSALNLGGGTINCEIDVDGVKSACDRTSRRTSTVRSASARTSISTSKWPELATEEQPHRVDHHLMRPSDRPSERQTP